MWAQSNLNKISTKVSDQREKQRQSNKNKKTTEDIDNVKTDSGFLSGTLSGSLSCEIPSKENIEYERHEDLKEETDTTIDSGCIIDPFTTAYYPEGETTLFKVNCPETFTFGLPKDKFLPSEPDIRNYFEQNEDGDTALHDAILQCHVKLSIQLIDFCPDPKLLNLRNVEGQTALHYAVQTNQQEIIYHLMKKSANVEILDCNGNSAVHLACYDGNLECLKILASYVLLPKVLETINYDGLACIHIATIHNHLNVLKFIVNTSKNLNITDYKSGFTALHFAVALNRTNLIDYLCDKVDPNIESYAGKLAFGILYDSEDDEEDDELILENLTDSMNALVA